MISQLVSMVSLEYDDDSRRLAVASERIKPVAQVVVAGSEAAKAAEAAFNTAQAAAAPQPAGAAGSAAASGPIDVAKGEEVFSGACVACHASGAAGAPMLTAKADWETRAAQGFDTLVSHAVNGYNAMPAKGGNPSLTENDIRNSIAYMMGEVGIELDMGSPAMAEAAPPAAAPTEAAPPAGAEAPPPEPAAQAEAPPPAAPPAAQEETAAAPAPETATQPAPLTASGQPLSPEQAIDAADWAAVAAQEAATAAERAARAAEAASKAADMIRQGAAQYKEDAEKISQVEEPVLIIQDETLEMTSEDIPTDGESAENTTDRQPENTADAMGQQQDDQTAPAPAIAEPAPVPSLSQESMPLAEESASAGEDSTEGLEDSVAQEPAPEVEETPQIEGAPSADEEMAGVSVTPPMPSGAEEMQVIEEAIDPMTAKPVPIPPVAIPKEQEGASPVVTPLTAEQLPKEKEIVPAEPLATGMEAAPSGVEDGAATSTAESASTQQDDRQEETIAAITPPEAPGVAQQNVNLARGEELYKSACVACHLTGIAGAPKLDDKIAWMPRLKQSFETLVEHAINGYRAMPPKGGRLDIPDDEIMSAVGYMMSKVK
jgi:cytochrome c5